MCGIKLTFWPVFMYYDGVFGEKAYLFMGNNALIEAFVVSLVGLDKSRDGLCLNVTRNGGIYFSICSAGTGVFSFFSF